MQELAWVAKAESVSPGVLVRRMLAQRLRAGNVTLNAAWKLATKQGPVLWADKLSKTE